MKIFVSPLLTACQLRDMFERANDMITLDEESGEYKDATLLDYLEWSSEEAVANS